MNRGKSLDGIRHNVLPVLAAFIWGTAFVAQDLASEHLGAFSVNFSRSFVAAIFLGVLALVVDLIRKRKAVRAGTWVELTAEEKKKGRKMLLIAGGVCGTILSLASVLQQAGIAISGAGKAGFLTALYVVIVPILGIFLKKHVPFEVWIAAIIAVCGLFLLCVKAGTGFKISSGDLLLVASALAFSVQIMVIDHYSLHVDGIKLSCAQFAVETIWCGIGMLIFEHFTFAALWACILPILYCGIMSSGIAYTLQIISQKGANPAIVSILMSLESVFATISAAVLLGDVLTFREYIGGTLMFIAVVLSQVPALIAKKKDDSVS